MATENSTVQISIKVVDANSGQVIAQTAKNVEQLGTAGAKAGQQLATGLKAAGDAGTQGGKSIADGMKHASEHTLNAMDNVRLLRDDLGIRIPRAMEKVISQSSAAMSVIGGIGTALVGLGSLQLAISFGTELYKFYDKLQDVNGEMRKYAQQASQASEQKIFDTQNIEEANALLRQNSALLDANTNLKQRARVGDGNQGSIEQYLRRGARAIGLDSSTIDAPIYNQADDAERARLKANDDLLKSRVKQINDKRAVDLLESQASIDSRRLTGSAAIEAKRVSDGRLAELRRAQVVDDLQIEHDRKVAANKLIEAQNPKEIGEMKWGHDARLRQAGWSEVPDVNKSAGMQEQQDAIARANGEAGAARTATARKENDDVERMREEAHAAGLQGEEKFQAQLMAKIEGFRRRMREGELLKGAGNAMIDITNQQATAEAAERLRAEQAEDRRRFAASAGAGNTGLARMDDQRAASLAAIDDKEKNHGYVDPSQAGRDRGYVNQTSDIEAAKAQKDFTDRLAQMDDSRANSSMSANQRIDAETRRTVAEIQKTWDELYSHLASDDTRRLQGQIALNGEIAKLNAAAAAQKAEATRGIADETRHMEDEAARYGLPKYQEQQRAIVDEYRERYEKLEQLRAKDKDNDDLYRRQEVAAEQIKNGKLLDERRQLRDKLAGELRGFMSNPLEALKKQGEEIASKAAADLILGTGKNAKGGVGGGPMDLFRGTFKRNAGIPGMGGDAPHAEHGSTAQNAVVNATTAVIHVGSASFAGAGPGAGAATVAGIAGGGYVPTGNGGYFNMGSGSSGASAAEAGSPAASIGIGGGSGGTLGVESRDNSDIATMGVSDAMGDATAINDASKDFGLKGGLQSKIPGLKNMSDENMDKLGGTVGGALGVFSAFEGKGGVMGGFQGALSGAKMGAQFGGPLGALLGAGVGGVLGFIGHGARVEAQKYWRKELMPKLQAEMLGFEAGTADYQTVYDDLNSSELEARNRTKQMGPGAVSYYNDTIKPAIAADMTRLTREQKAGRSQFGMTAAQAHFGGILNDFGSMATSADEGWVHAQRGEMVLNQQAAMSHADVASMMNAGTSRADIASYMGGGSGGERAAVQTGGDVNLHFNSHDAKGAYNLFMENAHHVRAALNQSYSEDSGGSN